jgi:hypothetical protein
MHEKLSVRLFVIQKCVPCSWHHLTTVIDADVILRFHTDDTKMSLQEQLSLTMSLLTKLNSNVKHVNRFVFPLQQLRSHSSSCKFLC